MTTSDSEKIILSLDADTRARLKAAAALEGVSVDEYCKEAIEAHLDEDEIFRAPVKLTLEYVNRFARIREETARMKETEPATDSPGEDEPSDRLVAINRLAALREETPGGKAARGNAADDIRRMREERTLNLERVAKGRRRRKFGD